MSYSAAIISNEFVLKGIEDGKPLTQMKLQKVVYFAHGLHLAKDLGPIIDESFEAWRYGPVVPEIYHSFKFFGSEPINDLTALKLFFTLPEYSINIETKKILDSTWDSLKNANAIALSAWTHSPNSPWSKFYKQGINSIPIPNEEIKKYFKEQFIDAKI